MSPNTAVFTDVESYAAPDPSMFVVKRSKPNAVFVDILKDPSLPVRDPPCRGKDKAQREIDIIGTGPYNRASAEDPARTPRTPAGQKGRTSPTACRPKARIGGNASLRRDDRAVSMKKAPLRRLYSRIYLYSQRSAIGEHGANFGRSHHRRHPSGSEGDVRPVDIKFPLATGWAVHHAKNWPASSDAGRATAAGSLTTAADRR